MGPNCACNLGLCLSELKRTTSQFAEHAERFSHFERRLWSTAFFPMHDYQCVGQRPLAFVGGRIPDPAIEPERGRATAIQIHRLDATKLFHEGSEFGKAH